MRLRRARRFEVVLISNADAKKAAGREYEVRRAGRKEQSYRCLDEKRNMSKKKGT